MRACQSRYLRSRVNFWSVDRSMRSIKYYSIKFSTEWTVLNRCVFIYISQRLLCWADNFSSLFTMLTELTRVDLSSDSYYSYEDMGPSSSSSPLSSDSAFGDQLTCSVELVSVHYYQYNGDWALGRGLRKRRSGDKIR